MRRSNQRARAGRLRGGWVRYAGMALLVFLVVGVFACIGCGDSAEGVFETVATDASDEVVTTSTSKPPATTVRANPWTERKPSTSTVAVAEAGSSSSSGVSVTGTVTTSESTSTSLSTVTGGSSTTHGAATGTSQSATTTTRATTTTTATTTTGGPTVLEVTGPSGTRSYTLAQLKAEAAVSGYWGAHKDNTSIHVYTGVPLSDLLADVGGLPSGKGLRITASDGFTCDYEPWRLDAMTNGTYQMWDCNGTLVTWADDIETTGSVLMVVAYAIDGGPLPTSGEGAGPLRVVLIQDNQNMLTEGKYSPYLVKSIVVR